MPSELDHIACANRTQRTIQHLLSDLPTHSPWIATAAFYKALQVVEAVFATSGFHAPNHAERDRKLKERKYQKIAEHYFPLQRASVNARYLAPDKCFDDYLSPEEVVSDLLKHHLHQVEQSAKKFLNHADQLNCIGDAFKSEPSESG